MNEIDKLKIEHARYKKALEDIKRGVYNTEPSEIAARALNPPPPPVPEEIKDLLRLLRLSDYHSIRFFGDRSGFLADADGENQVAFYSFQEALDYLKV